MNQTEILKTRHGSENTSQQNLHHIDHSSQNSAITIIKTNNYQSHRDKTPKIQSTSKPTSSNKIIRVSSSKGINVLSVRPSSSQKQIRQFSTGNNNNTGISSSTTIKLDQLSGLQQMREQLKKATLKYQDKMNQELSYQHNFLTVEIDRLKEQLVASSEKLANQEHQLGELLNRVETVEKKIQIKTNLMSKQIQQFKRFYDQCYNYTIKRITEAETNIKSVINYVNENTSTQTNIESWKYVEYANSLIKNIVTRCSAENSSLKVYVDQEIYDLELGLSKFHDQYEELDRLVFEMKSVKFGNQSFKDSVKELGKFGIKFDNQRNHQYRENFLEYYEPKFRQIIKRVNNSMIEIDLIKTLVKTESQAESSIKLVKIEELNRTIDILSKKMEQDKKFYLRQLAQKQDILNKSNPRILELETKLHANYQHEAKMIKQITELKQKVSYYQTKCEKNSQREFGIQSTLAEAFAQTLVKQKTKKFLEEKSVLENQIKVLEARIKQLDHQNFLLAEKFSKQSSSVQENMKLDKELKFTTKLIQQFQDKEKKNELILQENRRNMEALQRCMEEERNKNKILVEKIQTMIKEKDLVKQDDQDYFIELEEEVANNYKQIERLEKINSLLTQKNKQLHERNKILEEDLHDYAETFEKQSITFRTALQNLQKQKDYLGAENKKIFEQNKSLKADIDQARTTHSFYQNSSGLSLQLRKTVSTELGFPKTPTRKLQRKAYSNKELANKTTQLQNVLEKLKYDLPVVCQIDATGYLKDQKTGCYFVDENDNYFALDQNELAKAVKMGLILL